MHRDRRIVLVAGEPGIGKTRLAHQFASAALAAGATVLDGPLLGGATRAVRAVRRGAALGPAQPTRSQPGDSDDAGARHRLFDAVDAALADLAASAPLLLVIDDFHWADRGTLLLTSFLLRSSRTGPMLVLGTYRDTELGRHTPLTAALAELQRDGALDRIDLRGLPLEDVAALARVRAGRATTSRRACTRAPTATRSSSRRC